MGKRSAQGLPGPDYYWQASSSSEDRHVVQGKDGTPLLAGQPAPSWLSAEARRLLLWIPSGCCLASSSQKQGVCPTPDSALPQTKD